ncbi:MAG: AMP-binding protein, partial [Acidimicrobiales bacterium]
MTVTDLIAIALPANAFAARVQQVWAEGNAVLPVDLRLPGRVQRTLIAEMAPSHLITREGSAVCENARPVDGDVALVMPTSGSTGSPKGVVHTHTGLEAAARASNLALRTTEDDTWLSCLPLAHIGGFSVLTRAWQAKSGLEILDRFTAENVTASKATMVSLVPAMLARVDASQFRTVLLGGAAPPENPAENCVVTYGL